MLSFRLSSKIDEVAIKFGTVVPFIQIAQILLKIGLQQNKNLNKHVTMASFQYGKAHFSDFRNDWQRFPPFANVLWILYLIDKILKTKYDSKAPEDRKLAREKFFEDG